MPTQIKLYQPAAFKSLARALQRQRLPHGLILASPSDVGEKEIVQNLAKYLFCGAKIDFLESCNQCHSCKAVADESHPDLHIVRPKGLLRSIKTSDILDLIHKVQTTSHEGGAKIGVIFQAETLRTESANRLLKTLEEPPPNTYFILVTTRLERLLQTIKSRCQIVRLLPLSDEIICQRLNQKYDLDAENITFISSIARGRWGRAEQVAHNIDSYRSDLVEIVSILSDRYNSAAKAVVFAQRIAKRHKKLRTDFEDRVKQALSEKRSELKDLDSRTRKTILNEIEEQLKSEQATLERDAKSGLFEMMIELSRDLLIYKEMGEVDSLTHKFLADEIKVLADLYSQNEIIRNLREIELVRGPAVYLNAKFDVVLQGLLSNMTGEIQTYEPLQRAIAATGL